MKVWQVAAEDPSMLRSQHHGKATNSSSVVESSQLESRRQAVCASEGRARGETQALGRVPQMVSKSQILDLNYLHCWSLT